MTAYRIPTSPYPDTTQRTQLGSSTYSMRLRWNERGESWQLDLADGAGNPLLDGLRLVTLYPLLSRFRYNPSLPPGELWFMDTRDLEGKPTLEGMGDRFRLYYVDETGQWY